MRKIIDIQKEWFDKSNELFVDLVKRGGDAYLKDITFLNLKRDVYFALSTLTYEISDGRVELPGMKLEREKAKIEGPFGKFESEIHSIFKRFEKGRDYQNSGFIESAVDLIGRRSHSLVFQNLGSDDLKVIQKETEKFWIEFFKLKNTESQGDEVRLKELLNDFKTSLTEQISA